MTYNHFSINLKSIISRLRGLSLKNNIKKFRIEKGIKQKDMEAAFNKVFGLKPGILVTYESGANDPHYYKCLWIANYLKKELYQVFPKISIKKMKEYKAKKS